MENPPLLIRFLMLRPSKGLLLAALIFLVLPSCATLPKHPPAASMLAYAAQGDSLSARYAPVFLIEDPAKEYNHIGSPEVQAIDGEQPVVSVDPDHPAFFTQTRYWQGKKQSYTNLVYRIHFPEVPFQLVPFYLGAGKNIGLFVIITLDSHMRPVLFTAVHTCGCYLTFVPTSFMTQASFPDGWKKGRQNVYGEYLPSFLDYNGAGSSDKKLFILLHNGTHRIADLWLASKSQLSSLVVQKTPLKPLASLTRLPAPDGTTISFFETSGPRKDYVRGSEKPWERLLMSWWALDWRIGEDKRLGRNLDDGIVFYTSLKPWARSASDLRDFPDFLRYWGWRLQ